MRNSLLIEIREFLELLASDCTSDIGEAVIVPDHGMAVLFALPVVDELSHYCCVSIIIGGDGATFAGVMFLVG